MRIHLKIVGLIIFSFVFCTNLCAREEVSASLSKNEISVGDIIDFTVKAKLEQNAQISANQDFSFDGFDILNLDIEHIIVGKENVYELKFKLLADKVGDVIINPNAVFFINADGTNNLFFTPKKSVVVKSILGQDNNYDIKDIKKLKKIRLGTMCVVLISMLIILIGLIFYLLVCSYINRPKDIVEDPQLEALRELSLLYETRSSVDVKDFYYKMSKILRTYISKKYKFYALEMTTSEFFKKMKPLLPSTINALDFKKYLSVFNLARYASFTPSQTEIKNSYDFTKTLLEIL
ncbi:MAG: hypothetical protein LBP57_00600 [Endomicrobium sp.]|jgi:hypothetical protein|nr:hypothetical protein [Endomicrobium sp.]